MGYLYITRHGETEWNLQKRMQGWQDSKLTQLGEKQAEWLADRLKDVNLEAIYSSPSGRTMKTAEIVRSSRNIEITEKQDLKEINLGEWEGELAHEIQIKNPEAFHRFWKEPQNYSLDSGESFYDLKVRVIPLLEKIIDKHYKFNTNRDCYENNVLIVTHAVVLKVMMAYFLNRPMARLWDPPYIYQTCLNLIHITDQGYKVLLHGDISHHHANHK